MVIFFLAGASTDGNRISSGNLIIQIAPENKRPVYVALQANITSLGLFFSILFLSLAGIFIIDQNIKSLFLDGYRYYSDCIDLTLVFNKGVAFSMFAFLKEYLKYIQIALMLVGIIYLYLNKEIFKIYYIPSAFLLAGGISNIVDRFVHGGVVDYVYWHCGFDFAIFNLADVLIDIAVALILYTNYKATKASGK
jgi:signal peptidase II